MAFRVEGMGGEECESFLEAERLAKKKYAVLQKPVKVTRDGVLLAVIKADPEGRVWADLTIEGCRYA